MARLEKLPAGMAEHLLKLPCPQFEEPSFVHGPPLTERRVAIVSTAGLHLRGDRPFTSLVADYRVIPGDVSAGDLLMSHISVNYDRSGFQQDWNVVFPIDRLHALAQRSQIGSVADFHYSFMGAVDPVSLEPTAADVAGLLARDRVDAALLVPV